MIEAPECWNCGALASDAACPNCGESDPLRDLKAKEVDDRILRMKWDDLRTLISGRPRPQGSFDHIERAIRTASKEIWRVHPNNPERKSVIKRLRSILAQLDPDDLTCLELSRVVPWADVRGVVTSLRLIDEHGKQTQLGRAVAELVGAQTEPRRVEVFSTSDR